jgi:hypothetical protein
MMNRTHSHTKLWIERGSLLLVGATLLGSAAGAAPNEYELLLEEPLLPPSSLLQPSAMGGLREALQGGTFWATFRYRFENVDQDHDETLPTPFTKKARASTLQARLGYKSAEWKGFSGVLEFSDVVNIDAGNHDYDDGTGVTGAADRPLVADPVGAQVNQVYLKYSGALGGDLKLGRQRIKLDNDRFIGNVGWRQTEQNFDAISFNREWASGFRVFYGYIDYINNIFQKNQDADSHLLNLSKNWDNVGKLTLYGYYLDFVDEGDWVKSTFTYGGRFVGEHNMGDWGLLYGVELAHQNDAEDNPNKVDASYSNVHLGGKLHGAHLKVGFESLEGDGSGNLDRAFQTPLATLHAHNGWADKFLKTPAAGLEDTYFDLGYTHSDLAVGAVYHEFDSEIGAGTRYGDEFDLYAKYAAAEDLEFGVKFASFDASNLNTLADTEKFWFWMAYSF